MRSNSVRPVIHVANVARDTCSTGNIWCESCDGWLSLVENADECRGGALPIPLESDAIRREPSGALNSSAGFTSSYRRYAESVGQDHWLLRSSFQIWAIRMSPTCDRRGAAPVSHTCAKVRSHRSLRQRLNRRFRRYSFQSSPVSLRTMVFIAALASSVDASMPIVLPRKRRCSWRTPRTNRKT